MPRPKGSPNKTNVNNSRRAARVVAQGQSPLEFMLEQMRDESVEMDVRREMAKAAAPYCHARLSATTVKEEKPSGARDVSTDKLKAITGAKAA